MGIAAPRNNINDAIALMGRLGYSRREKQVKRMAAAGDTLYDGFRHPRERTLVMALYSVHLKGSGLQSIAGAAFVRQAFSWKAFFFGPLWLAWYRLWTILLLWAGAYLILLAASPAVLWESSVFYIALALQFLLGLEANRLLEAKLAAQGYHLVEIIAAPARDQAETAFFRQIESPDEGLDLVSGAQGGARPWGTVP